MDIKPPIFREGLAAPLPSQALELCREGWGERQAVLRGGKESSHWALLCSLWKAPPLLHPLETDTLLPSGLDKWDTATS